MVYWLIGDLMQQEAYSVMNELKDCPICKSPVSKKDLDNYRMCHWCYSQQNFENEGGAIQ